MSRYQKRVFCDEERIDSSCEAVRSIVGKLEIYALEKETQAYLISSPLSSGERYDNTGCMAVIVPGRKILLGSTGAEKDDFEEYCEDFIEDLGVLASRHGYRGKIGRPRKWRDVVLCEHRELDEDNIVALLDGKAALKDSDDKRLARFLASLAIGCINDIQRLQVEEPDNYLDRVKQKIILFDAQQTRFVYQRLGKKRITIQGLAGSGKTELLLHRLRRLYLDHSGEIDNRIFLTCHNKVLAQSLNARVISFFNFMKVEEQIEWGTRLHVARSWGSRGDPESGLYSFICNHYGIQFRSYSQVFSFSDACRLALDELPDSPEPCLDYILVDESQDFPDSFFELCDRVTSKQVYVAGDVFQDIFGESTANSVEPDYTLTHCYRTDPRTLLFAHALNLGLCETPVINWLEDEAWLACGDLVTSGDTEDEVRITREPFSRFGIEEDENEVSSISIRLDDDIVGQVIETVIQIKQNHPTVQPGDIAVVFPGNGSENYDYANRIRMQLATRMKWDAVKAYETKEVRPDAVFISNINNVKGLEFPFVICYVTGRIGRQLRLRNALYMLLTRSFISSFIISCEENKEFFSKYQPAINELNTRGRLTVRRPSEEEIHAQREEFRGRVLSLHNDSPMSVESLIDEEVRRYGVNGHDAESLRRQLLSFFEDDAGFDDPQVMRKRIGSAIELKGFVIPENVKR